MLESLAFYKDTRQNIITTGWLECVMSVHNV